MSILMISLSFWWNLINRNESHILVNIIKISIKWIEENISKSARVIEIIWI